VQHQGEDALSYPLRRAEDDHLACPVHQEEDDLACSAVGNDLACLVEEDLGLGLANPVDLAYPVEKEDLAYLVEEDLGLANPVVLDGALAIVLDLALAPAIVLAIVLALACPVEKEEDGLAAEADPFLSDVYHHQAHVSIYIRTTD